MGTLAGLSSSSFSTHSLRLDAARETERLVEAIRRHVFQTLNRRGAVVGVSGGVDSALVAALCSRALGARRTVALFMPEADSSPDSLRLGRLVASSLGLATIHEDITPALQAARCYERRDDAVRLVVPQYSDGWQCKLSLPDVVHADRYSLFDVVVRSPQGAISRSRLTLPAYLGILAATNFKQRIRAMYAYHYADLYQFAVAGTPNRLECELGFFVKNGDGAADFKPIAHLYKTQVYQLAAHLGVPGEILERPPTTDTYPLEQSQEDFYFALPLAKMDLCLYSLNQRVPLEEVADATGLSTGEVQRVFRSIEARRRAARYLHTAPLYPEARSATA